MLLYDSATGCTRIRSKKKTNSSAGAASRAVSVWKGRQCWGSIPLRAGYAQQMSSAANPEAIAGNNIAAAIGVNLVEPVVAVASGAQRGARQYAVRVAKMLRAGLCSFSAMLAAPRAHPLTKNKKVKLTDLANESLLLLDDGHCLRDQALEVCQMAGTGERHGFRATSLETLRHMASANGGMTLMPALSVHAPSRATPGVVLIPFTDPASHRRIAMLLRRTSALTAFLHKLAPLFKDLPAGVLNAPKELSVFH